MDVDLPDVHAEVSAVFALYEDALVNNRVELLDALFWDSPLTLRYGVAENLYGIDRIRAFRAARSAVGLQRALRRTVITTFGRDFATAHTEFLRPPPAAGESPRRIGRQSQTWCRIGGEAHGGWRVVAAHVSVIDAPPEPLTPDPKEPA
jgi:hypothetical protein